MNRRVLLAAVVALLALGALPVGGCTMSDFAYALPLELTAPVSAPQAAAPPPSPVPATVPDVQLLTVADVEAACGVNGVCVVPKGAKASAVGDLNFADSADNVILTVTFEPASVYGGWKSIPSQYRGDIAGVGDEAFLGPSAALSAFPTRLAFLSSGRAVAVATYHRYDGTAPYLGEDQLRAVAAVVIGRLQ